MAGLGRAGRAALDALARSPGSAIVAWDSSPSASVAQTAAELRERGIDVELGGNGVSLLDRDPPPRCVVKSPGIPFDAPLVVAARDRGVSVLDEAEIGWRLDSRPLIGVTGTNGKSTVCALVEAVLSRGGARPVVAGNTTFGPPLSALADVSADVVVAELSSFQLSGAPELLPEAAVFTNLSDDHWEHHGGRDAYAAAKRRLFARGERRVPLAAVNVDDRLGEAIANDVAGRGSEVVSFGECASARVSVRTVASTMRSSTLALTIDGEDVQLDTRLAGRHNALNAAAAVALAVALELDLAPALAAVADCPPVPGRFEHVDAGQPYAVIVDYAHNPAGVRAVLATVRAAAAGRVIVVSSALSVLDARQHREAGAALAAADELIVTLERTAHDDPREDPPPGLLDGVVAAGGRWTVVTDRREAIRHAVGRARGGDTVLILNRGIRRTPILDADDRPYRPDDREEARAAIREASGR